MTKKYTRLVSLVLTSLVLSSLLLPISGAQASLTYEQVEKWKERERLGDKRPLREIPKKDRLKEALRRQAEQQQKKQANNKAINNAKTKAIIKAINNAKKTKKTYTPLVQMINGIRIERKMDGTIVTTYPNGVKTIHSPIGKSNVIVDEKRKKNRVENSTRSKRNKSL